MLVIIRFFLYDVKHVDTMCLENLLDGLAAAAVVPLGHK